MVECTLCVHDNELVFCFELHHVDFSDDRIRGMEGREIGGDMNRRPWFELSFKMKVTVTPYSDTQ